MKKKIEKRHLMLIASLFGYSAMVRVKKVLKAGRRFYVF